MNNKGFTLPELLMAVAVIVTVIVVTARYNVASQPFVPEEVSEEVTEEIPKEVSVEWDGDSLLLVAPEPISTYLFDTPLASCEQFMVDGNTSCIGCRYLTGYDLECYSATVPETAIQPQ